MKQSEHANILLLIRSEVRRIVSDLGRHLTLLLCAAALVGLFFYVFRDFIGNQLASLDRRFAEQALQTILSICALIAGVMGGNMSERLRSSEDSFLPVMIRMGTPTSTVNRHKQALVILPAIVAALLTAISCLILNGKHIVLLMMLAAASSILFAQIQIRRYAHRETNEQQNTPNHPYTGVRDWRMHQVLYRPVPGRMLMTLGVGFSLLIPCAALLQQHTFVLQLTALCCGLTSALGLVQTIAADLPGTWFEKQAGLTHDQWLKSWQQIANILAAALFVSGACGLLLLPQTSLATTAGLPVIAGFLPWITPSLILQIDGRAKTTNTLVLLIVGLFIGTAIIATPWAAIIVPILKSQAWSYQRGRFYRA